MMSYTGKLSRSRAPNKTWLQDQASPPNYNLPEQLFQLQQQTPLLQHFPSSAEDYRDIHDYWRYNADFVSLSPCPYQSTYENYCNPVENGNDSYELNGCEGEFLEKDLFSMDETFRTALTRYFAQVDKEKQGLTDDLKKIKNDFHKYEEETKKLKVDYFKKGKIIQKLTENGKLFVKEIERLKDDLRGLETQRRQVIAENNELQKKLKYENNTVPQLENELKCLAEENQFLKLLAEDTQKLTQQDQKIQHYSSLLEKQEKTNQHLQNDLKKHDFAVKKLTKINNDLCQKIKELSCYKNKTEEFKKLSSEYKELEHKYSRLEIDYNHMNIRMNNSNENNVEMQQIVKRSKEENFNLRGDIKKLERDSTEKNKVIEEMEIMITDMQKKHDVQVELWREKEDYDRCLEMDNTELQRKISSLEKDINLKELKSEALIHEDQLRHKELQILEKKFRESEQMCEQLRKKDVLHQNELFDHHLAINSFAQTEIQYKNQIKSLDGEITELREHCEHTMLVNEQHAIREEELENEILSHVKTQSEMQQEIALMYNTIDTLRKSNENCDAQRKQMQKELLFAQDSIATLNRKVSERSQSVSPVHSPSHKISNRVDTKQYEMLKEMFDKCENQRNRLQKEVLVLQERLTQMERSLQTEQNQVEMTSQHVSELKGKLEGSVREGQIRDGDLNQAQNDIEFYVMKIQMLEKELNAVPDKLKVFEYKGDQVNENYCSNSTEWYVDGELCISDERPYQEKNQSKCSMALNSQSQCHTGANEKNNCEEKMERFRQNCECLEKELKTAQNESQDKSILIEQLTKDIEANKKFIAELCEEKNNLHSDLQDVVKEIAYFRKGEKESELAILDKDHLIKELEYSVEHLKKAASEKEAFAEELEALVEKLQFELDKKTNRQEENLNQLNEELTTKNDLIADLESYCEELKEKNDRKGQFVENLQAALKSERQIVTETKRERLSTAQQTRSQEEEIQTLKESLATKEQELIECKTKLIEENSNADASCSLRTGKETISNQQQELRRKTLELENLKSENEILSEKLNDLEHSSKIRKTESETHKDGNYISQDKYEELTARLETKQQQLSDCQEHIQILQSEITFVCASPAELDVDSLDTSGFESMRGRTEKREITPTKHNLKLPTPEKMNQEFQQRRSSLPPIPGRNPNKMSSLHSRSSSSDRLKDLDTDTAVKRIVRTDSRSSDVNSGELRRKLVLVNSELLQRKMEVSSLQEELKLCKRKQVRMEESYRMEVSKNENLEHEILDNRRKIQIVREKQKANEITEKEDQNSIHYMKKDLYDLERSYDNLHHMNETLTGGLKERDETCLDLKQKLKRAEDDVQHWRHSVDVLEQECQKLSMENERLQMKLSENQSEANDIKLHLEIAQKEKQTWIDSRQTEDFKIDELQIKCNQLEEDLFTKDKLYDKLKEQLKIGDQEHSVFEKKILEYNIKVKVLEEKISESENEKRQLQNEIEKLQFNVHGNDLRQQDLMSEKDLAQHNIRHQEKKIEELKKTIQHKEEKLTRYIRKYDDKAEQVAKVTDDLTYSNLEIQRLTNDLTKETKSIKRLEKLNEDMNNENKRLMHELIKLQDRLKVVSEENEVRRDKLSQAEKEQSNIDNLLIKSQKSNSELLEATKTAGEELRMTKNKVNQLVQELEEQSEENKELEKKLGMVENELHCSTERLSKDNDVLTHEVNDSRRIIRELESILDQGQLDFDEMDMQLGKYRKENMELDVKLHEVLKQQIALQSENDELQQKLVSTGEELQTLTDVISNQKKELQTYLQEKEETDGQLVECKSREEYFEERLRGIERTVTSKEDLLSSERKDKEKLQDELLKLQSELIKSKTYSENLRNDLEVKNKHLNEKTKIIENLEKCQNDVQQSKEVLVCKMSANAETVERYELSNRLLSEERDELENKYQECFQQSQLLESRLEDVKMATDEEKEELLATISKLKRELNENELQAETQNHRQSSYDSSLREAMSNNEQLIRQVEAMQKDHANEKEIALTTIMDLKATIQQMEYRKSEEMIELKATIDALENSRGQDITLLRMKLQEVEELRKKIGDGARTKSQMDEENTALKEDIVRLQSSLDLKDVKLAKIGMEVEEHKTHINYLEKHKLENETENQKMFKSAIEEKNERCVELETELKTMQNQLITFNNLQEENENLKSDLETLLNELGGMQTRLDEYNKMRFENEDLLSKADRVQEVQNENRMLKQELRDIESNHIEELNTLNRENIALRRSADELFKKNQDLELRNVAYVRTRPISTAYFEPAQPRLEPVSLTFQKKSASTNNINEAYLEVESFSPTKNAVATSTPTQETKSFTSAYSTKSPITEPTYALRQVKSVSSINDMLVDTRRKADASWNQPLHDENLRPSIRSNPFFKMDKETAENNWKIGMNASKVKPPSNVYNLPLNASMFDMRPKSTDIPEQTRKSPEKSLAIGNEFVNRLKATFENR